MLETEIKNLTAAVIAMTAAFQASGGVISQANGNIPASTPQPTTPAVTPQPTGAPQPTNIAPQPTAAAPAQAPGGITPESLKLKASDLAQRLGPRAAEISQQLSAYGAARLSELNVEHYGAFDAWLNGKIQECSNAG